MIDVKLARTRWALGYEYAKDHMGHWLLVYLIPGLVIRINW